MHMLQKKTGTFKIGGDLAVTRLGFGAMRITGPNIWGPPADVEEALRVLRRLPDLGIDLIDTADSYGPYISEELIRQALHPYGDIRIATKGGLVREGPNGDVPWPVVGRPKYLQQEVHMSKRRLGVDRIDLWQLHRIDPEVPREDQFRAIKEMQDEGHIHHLGLSNVVVDDIKAAQDVFQVTTVQNRYNVADRSSEDVLEYCEQQGVGFIPWAPLDVGELGRPGGPVAAAAEAHGATKGQIALAWLFARSPVMLPIPGTASVAHLEENAAAADLELSDEEFAAIDGPVATA
jgi:pyridoxine 4-dehydrogenase